MRLWAAGGYHYLRTGVRSRVLHFKLILCAVALFSLQLSVPALADEPAVAPASDSEEKSGENPQYDWLRRFKPYGMNYGVWKFSQEDEQALEVQYSFKYTLYNCERDSLFGCSKDAPTKYSGFFSYTGRFDFYMFTRESSPVINRTSNPALHANLEHTFKEKSSVWGDLSLEHRSNGQVTDVNTRDDNPASPTFGQYQTEIEYQKGNREYFDRISRDANYVNLAVGGKYHEHTRVDVGVKLYFTDDSEITWGKYAGTGAKFEDFDLVKLKAYHTFKGLYYVFPEVTVGLEYLIGRRAFAEDSIDLYLIAPLIGWGWEIPLMVKAHAGPMDRLSDYTRSINSIGAGIVFSF